MTHQLLDVSEEYTGTIRDFVDWCGHNHLQLNFTKTKEMVVDFRRRAILVNIQGSIIELVSSYRYLGVQLDHKLDGTCHTNCL